MENKIIDSVIAEDRKGVIAERRAGMRERLASFNFEQYEALVNGWPCGAPSLVSYLVGGAASRPHAQRLDIGPSL